MTIKKDFALEIAEKLGSLYHIDGYIIRHNNEIVGLIDTLYKTVSTSNKAFAHICDELGFDVNLHYKNT